MEYFSEMWVKQVNYFNWNTRKIPEHKRRLNLYSIKNNLLRTARMFKWNGFPKTIQQRFFELVIQTWGHIGIIEVDGEYYSCWGELGGEPNYNYMPSKYIIANPHITKNGISKVFNVYGKDKDVVVIPNDTLYRGLLPILSFHSELMTEIQLTKRAAIIEHRMPNILLAPDNNSKKDIDDFLGDLEDGNIASIFDKNLLRKTDTLQFGDGAAANILIQLIEMEQYEKASLFNDLGLQANYNMKRESLTSSENLLNIDALLPLCDDMLEMRKIGAEELSDFMHTEVTVEFDSSWKMLRDNIEIEKLISIGQVNTSNKSVQSNGNDEQSEDVHSNGNDEQSEDVQSNGNDEQSESVELPIVEMSAEIVADILKQDLKEEENKDENEETIQNT